MKTVLKYLKPQLGRMIVQISVKLAGTVIELFLPTLLSVILDTCAPKGDMHGVILMGGVMLLCAVMAWLGNVSANKMSTNISRDVTRELRKDLFNASSHLSASQRDALTEASLVSRLTSDTYNVHNMIDRLQRIGIRAPILLVGGIVVSLTLDPVLTLVLISTLPILTLIIMYSSKKGVPMFTHVQEKQDKMVRRIQENMAGARVIRALSKSRDEQATFARVNDELAKTQQSADMTMAAVSPLVNMVLNVGLAMVVLVGAYRVNAGLALPGTIIAFLSYFTIILNALISISRIFVMYSKGSASANRIEEVLTQAKAEDAREMAETRSAPEKNDGTVPHIEFRHVSFSYNKRQDDIHDVSFAAYHGQTIGIIGPTGSGKSTLVSLMLRLYTCDQGEILVDGRNIRDIPSGELYSSVGVVFQNDFIMADTIGENIRFGRDIAKAEMEKAAETAQADFIGEKEGGLDFPLNVKGRNLSGGQQQRLLITRALAGNPGLLLLDDCSSALDYRTDRNLRHALSGRHSATTTFIIAQRVSAVMSADMVIVVDGGSIIGMGTHWELCRTCGMYRELCALQGIAAEGKPGDAA